MALVTFMSDFGTEDHYVAAVKAAILRENPSTQVIDISHQVPPSDIGHASYILGSVFRDFPEGTVHLFGVDQCDRQASRLLAVKLEGHYFVGADCGIFSLLSSKPPAEIVELPSEDKSSTFAAKEILGPAAAHLSKGGFLSDLGPFTDHVKMMYPRQIKATKQQIVGNVIRIDHYGNLITNITRDEFETILKLNGNRGYNIVLGTHSAPRLQSGYHEVDPGDMFILFNSNGLLQIGIQNGKATELLGLHMDAQIKVEFASF